jgi:hypothetical protein
MAAMALAIIVRRSMETSRFRKLICPFVGRGGAAGSPFPEAVINGVACVSLGGIPALSASKPGSAAQHTE